jgi:hypothetical protein
VPIRLKNANAAISCYFMLILTVSRIFTPRNDKTSRPNLQSFDLVVRLPFFGRVGMNWAVTCHIKSSHMSSPRVIVRECQNPGQGIGGWTRGRGAGPGGLDGSGEDIELIKPRRHHTDSFTKRLFNHVQPNMFVRCLFILSLRV